VNYTLVPLQGGVISFDIRWFLRVSIQPASLG
jgi:hypothetical protein